MARQVEVDTFDGLLVTCSTAAAGIVKSLRAGRFELEMRMA